MTQATQIQGKGILLSEAALKHLTMLKEPQGKDLCLRVGVRQGGCSGMSYMMDFEHPSNIAPKMRFSITMASKLSLIKKVCSISTVSC